MRKRGKFRNIKTNGFDSKGEAKRAIDLQLWEKLGVIKDLKYQVRYEVIPKQEGERPAHYIADFTYIQDGEQVVEDFKSPASKTPEYVLKRKLMLFFHGIRIKETGVKSK